LFSSFSGTSGERAAHGLTQMGPAILNGGITTFLALFFLAFSQSYAFIVFFKVSAAAEKKNVTFKRANLSLS
jgi:Niemann-Pick C1 protein